MTRTLVSGDWHLGTYSPPAHRALALGFLRWAAQAGDQIVLNGDIFEGLFESPARGERAHPEVAALIGDLTARGALRRTQGNHDPDGGVASLVLQHAVLGRVLVAHGHLADPVHVSSVGNFGDGISRRLGHLRLVRGAAWMAESVVAGTLAGPVDRLFRRRCLALMEREGCGFGIFGHNHRRHLVPGDPYANAGRLLQARLEYLVLDDTGPSLRDFTVGGAAAGVVAAS
ncbi:MAG: metallophosphoesterase [Gemmatimonadaceae bacterium]